MLIQAKITAAASRDTIKKQKDGSYKIWVKAAPFRGYANKAVIDVIAKYFDTKPNCVRITRGQTSPYKTISID